jgi:hypothetical protein
MTAEVSESWFQIKVDSDNAIEVSALLTDPAGIRRLISFLEFSLIPKGETVTKVSGQSGYISTHVGNGNPRYRPDADIA